MANQIQPQNVQSLQSIEAVVNGPDGANRLIIITGLATAIVQSFSNNPDAVQQQRATYTLLVGPQLSRQQFVRAIAIASPTVFDFDNANHVLWSLTDVDADFDDESQRVELRVEINTSVRGPAGNSNSGLFAFGFQVTILAAL